jgi:GT2 family glycosyltransferase
MSKVTIITNTIRRPLELVEKSVRSSLAQDPSVEVILVDQNEIPLDFPSDISSNPRFRHQHEVVPAVSMARNRANYGKESDWLIFCDDDGYLEQGYLQKLTTLIIQNPLVDIFAGSIKRIDNGNYYSKRHSLGGDMKWFWNTKLLMGSNFAIKRTVFENMGKFDERFGAGASLGSSEETDLAWNAFFNGFRMMFAPDLVVFHVPPFIGKSKDEIKKAFRYGIGKGALVLKWLLKGDLVVLYELVEMLVLPMIKLPINVLSFRMKNALVLVSSFIGRIVGFFAFFTKS